MSAYAYYPGCSLHATAYEYDRSFRTVCAKLNIELVEVNEWVCCGTTPAHSTSQLLATALPARTLVNAGKGAHEEVVVPCAACFQRLKVAAADLEQDEALRKEVNGILGEEYSGGVTVSHPLETFAKTPGLDEFRKAVTRPLKELTIACYYGCLLTRPPDVMVFDQAENPQSMDELLRACQAKVPDWSYKTDCCGASFSLTRTDIVLDLVHKLLSNARAVGADAVAVACPLCHANLDGRQAYIADKHGESHDLPIFYFTQLMGLALGAGVKELGLKGHMVTPIPLLKEKGLLEG